MEPRPNPNTVTIRPDTDERGAPIYRVEPPLVRLQRGQSLVFQHPGSRGAVAFIPVPGLFDEGGLVFPMEKAPGGLRLELHVSKDAPLVRGEFEYSIFCADLKKMAVGFSPPKMILDDPTDRD